MFNKKTNYYYVVRISISLDTLSEILFKLVTFYRVSTLTRDIIYNFIRQMAAI